MSQIRSFFDQRTSYPGYVSYMVIIIMNLDILLEIFKNPQFNQDYFSVFSSIVITSITVIGGSVVGYVVSQPWFFIYNIINFFQIRCNVYPYNNIIMMNYINVDSTTLYHYYSNSNLSQEETNYLHRRWDIFNLLCSTLSSICVSWTMVCKIREILSNKKLIFTEPLIDYCLIKNALIILSLMLTVSLLAALIQHYKMTLLLMRIHHTRIDEFII